MVRPGDRRDRKHHECVQRDDRQLHSAFVQRGNDRRNPHDQRQDQHVHHDLQHRASQPDVHEPTLNRDVVEVVDVADARRIGDRVEPELGRLVRQQEHANQNGPRERRRQGHEPLDVLAHQEDQAEGQGRELDTRRNADQQTPRNLGRGAEQIGEDEEHDQRVDLHESQTATPRTRETDEGREQRDGCGASELVLQGDLVSPVIHVVVDDRREPPGHGDREDHHDRSPHLDREEREGQEQQCRERRICERQEGRLRQRDQVQVVEVLGDAVIAEDRGGTGPIHREVQAALGHGVEELSAKNDDDGDPRTDLPGPGRRAKFSGRGSHCFSLPRQSRGRGCVHDRPEGQPRESSEP